MKVYVANPTGTGKRTGELYLESGVIAFTDGSISHVIYEKQYGREVEEYKDEKHFKHFEAPKDVVTAPEELKTEDKSENQSDAPQRSEKIRHKKPKLK